MVFSQKQKIGKYIVAFPIKEGSYAETYRVKDEAGKNCFLKLFNYAKLNRKQFTADGNVIEFEISQKLHHPNLTAYKESGEIVVGGQKMAYIVYEFISGETVAEKTSREQRCSVADAKEIILGVLKGVKYLHDLDTPIIHNELTIQNVMLDMSKSGLYPKIIDFGYARFFNQSKSSFQKEGLSPFNMAPETFNGIFTPQSDIFSIGAMLYQLLFGIPPHFVDLSKFGDDQEAIEDALAVERRKPLRIPNIDLFELDEQLINTMAKAMAPNVDDRFSSVDEFIGAINGDLKVERVESTHKNESAKEEKPKNIRKGNGFADIAGTTQLKEQLQSDVIDLLNSPDQAKALGLSLPNGLLFYGPPGCGKTFFAEKFAEEMGCNYQYVKCSDVASPYIHGGQGKIAALFNEARKNAPTLLFFDEIEAMVKDRSKHNNVSEAGEVNEFLAQLNNCGSDGVIVIGATNKPSEIDEAALRAGRLELKYYIPQPDKETRAKVFEINLSKRSCDFGIDYDKLADMTENYVSADIKLIVEQAARLVFRRKEKRITFAVLEEAIRNTKPSLTVEQLKHHEQLRDQFEGVKKQEERKRIGFY